MAGASTTTRDRWGKLFPWKAPAERLLQALFGRGFFVERNDTQFRLSNSNDARDGSDLSEALSAVGLDLLAPLFSTQPQRSSELTEAIAASETSEPVAGLMAWQGHAAGERSAEPRDGSWQAFVASTVGTPCPTAQLDAPVAALARAFGAIGAVAAGTGADPRQPTIAFVGVSAMRWAQLAVELVNGKQAQAHLQWDLMRMAVSPTSRSPSGALPRTLPLARELYANRLWLRQVRQVGIAVAETKFADDTITAFRKACRRDSAWLERQWAKPQMGLFDGGAPVPLRNSDPLRWVDPREAAALSGEALAQRVARAAGG